MTAIPVCGRADGRAVDGRVLVSRDAPRLSESVRAPVHGVVVAIVLGLHGRPIPKSRVVRRIGNDARQFCYGGGFESHFPRDLPPFPPFLPLPSPLPPWLPPHSLRPPVPLRQPLPLVPSGLLS